MPADVPRSWPRGRRATSEAEEILATAEAWWDVDRSGFRDGDRFLRNIGTAGSALDLRLGSSGVANSNDPKWLGPEGLGYVYLPGSGGNNLGTTDNRAGTATTWQVSALLDTTAVALPVIYSRSSSAAALMEIYFRYSGANIRSVVFFVDGGGTQRQTTASSASGFPVGKYWYRWTVDASAANTVVTMEYADDAVAEPSTWTTFYTQTFTGVTGLTVPSVNARIGDIAYTTGGSAFQGRVFRLIERINGSTTLDVDCDAITSGAATSFTATTSQTVTINRSTSGRKSVAMPSKTKGGRPCMLLGTDDYLECQDAAQHGLLNFGQGDSFTALAVARRWATQVSAARIIVKLDASLTAPNGWSVANFSTGQFNNVVLSDGPNIINTGTTTAAWIAGTLTTNGMIVDRVARTLRPIINATIHTSTSTAAVGSAANTQTVRIGRSSGVGTSYADMEFTAAAVFRRALTAREITVIANAAPWGV